MAALEAVEEGVGSVRAAARISMGNWYANGDGRRYALRMRTVPH